ncbi:MAG: hypothetical protein EHM78_02405 [Myxococcaceae bacterium]|nr:MAG: hypothetical protein EHM78_02405 [Myxococcaceae bacterium]
MRDQSPASVGRLGGEDSLGEAQRLLENQGVESRQAKMIFVHLVREGPACRRCGAGLEGSGLVR